MFNTLKALFRATTEKPHEPNEGRPVAAGLPMSISQEDLEDLRLDGRVNIKLIGLRAHPDALFRWNDDAYHHIAAVGHVDLGQGAYLVRFYLDNDTCCRPILRTVRCLNISCSTFTVLPISRMPNLII